VRLLTRLVVPLVILIGASAPPAFAAPAWYEISGSDSPVNHDPNANVSPARLADAGGTPELAWNEAGAVRVARLTGRHIDDHPWTEIGGGPASTGTSLAVVGGVTYIAGVPYEGGHYQVRVQRLGSGGTWEDAGPGSLNVPTTDDSFAVSIASIGGVPYLAWGETSGGASTTHVKKLVGGTWTEIGTAARGLENDANFFDLADIGGVPYITYKGGSNVVVKKYDAGTDKWVAVGGGTVGVPNAGSPSIANVGGVPMVALVEYGVVKVYAPVSGTWQAVGGGTVGNGNGPSIVSVAGTPWVAWWVPSDLGSEIHAARLKSDKSAWEEPGGTGYRLNHDDALNADSPDMGTMVVNGTTVPVVAWREEDGPSGAAGTNYQLRVAAYGEEPVYSPQNKTPPTMSGTPKPHSTLTCAPGTWTNADPPPYTHRFVRSVAAGAFTPINNSDSTTYEVQPDDVGARIACLETAHKAGADDTDAQSNFKTVANGVPVNTQRPIITGSPGVGDKLNCGDGVWDPGALSFTRRWLRNGNPIAGQTGPEYTVQFNDRTNKISCEVTAKNDVGTGVPAKSDSVVAVSEPPARLNGPYIRLVNKPGPVTPTNKQLVCDHGSFSNDPGTPESHSFRIERDGGGILTQGGTHDVTVDDLGRNFYCVETVTNAKGPGEGGSLPVTVPLPPIDQTLGNVELRTAGSFNSLDPVNMMAAADALLASLAPEQLPRVQNSYASFATKCATKKLAPGLPKRLPMLTSNRTTQINDTCRMLLHSPSDEIHIFADGVHVYGEDDLANCYQGYADPCAPLPIIMLPAKPASTRVNPGILPKRVLWDLDGNGTTDLSCPGNAPIARTIYNRSWFKVRAYLVLPNSEKTGQYPSVEDYFNNHVVEPPPIDKPPVSIPGGPEQYVHENPDWNVVVNQSQWNLNLSLGKRQAIAAAAKPPSHTVLGKLRKAQPAWCWNKLEPPEVKEQPCIPEGNIGQVHVTGNICPISLRRIPDAELATMQRTDPELYNILVAQNDALGAAPTDTQGAYDEATQAFNSYIPGPTEIQNQVKKALTNAGIDPGNAPAILDQTAIVKGDSTINGVLVKAPRTLLLPSDIGDIGDVDSVKKMRVFASQAVPYLGGLPMGDPEKALNAEFKDAVDAGAQELVKNVDLDHLRQISSDFASKLNLGPFRLAGDAKVKIENGAANIEAQAELPLFNNARAKVNLRATPDGKIQFDGIRLDIGVAKLGALNLQKVVVDYKPAEGLLVQGQITFPWMGDAGIDIVEFRVDNHGEVTSVVINYLAGAGTGIPTGPGVFLTKLGGGFKNTKDAQEFVANAAVSVGPSAGGGCPTVGADGTMTMHFGPRPFFMHASVNMQLVCLGLANIDATVWEKGLVHIVASMGFKGGPAFFNASLTGDVDLPNWQIELNANGGVHLPSPLPDLSGSLDGVISNRGMAVCGSVVGFTGGAGIKWTPELLAGPLAIISNIRLFTGCGMNDFRSFPKAAVHRAQNGARSITVEPKQNVLLFSAEGLGAAPRAILRGPDGTVIDLSGDAAGVKTDRTLGMRVQEEDRDIFLVKAPAAGQWTVTPAPGSPDIVELKRSGIAPEPKISAKVARVGSSYELRWSVAKTKGQVVRLVEQAPGGNQTIVTVKEGGKGVTRFIPSESTGPARTIVAEVEQDGSPRENIDVVKFSAASPRVGKPGKIRVRRRGKGALVTWSPAFLANGYEVTVTTSSGARTLHVVKKGKRQLALKRLATSEGLTARIVGISRSGRSGPGGTGKLAKPKAKRKR
jgi:hypothetical protein